MIVAGVEIFSMHGMTGACAGRFDTTRVSAIVCSPDLPDNGEITAPMEGPMTINLAVEPVLAIVAGIAILLVPRLLNYIVAVYLLVVGVLGLT